MKKTTIYIDIDDDIAGIAEKIQNAPEKIVALVLPKRPSVLQGSVNMNLLKRSSDDAGKNIVLITNDDQVLRLAGQVGLYVASSLQSKPQIPSTGPTTTPAVDEIMDTLQAEDKNDLAQPEVYADDKKVDLKTPIGELAQIDDEEEIELDAEDDSTSSDKQNTSRSKDEKKKIAVPNFDIFRSRLGLGILGLIAIIGVFYWALVIAPKASITLTTQQTSKNAKITVTASKSQSTVDAEKALLPATRKEDKQKLTGTFTATGSKDVGTKATGSVTLKNCESTEPITIPAGTGVSKGAYTFIMQTEAELPGGSFSGGGSVCTTSSSKSVDVAVTASQPGDQYNLASGSYSVAGNFGNISAVGSAMGGGTSKIVKVVTSEDVESAKTKVLEKAADNVKGKVSNLLSAEGLVPISDTFVSEVGAPIPSVAVNAEATGDVTLTVEITSTMLGVKRSDIDPLLTKELSKDLNSATQKITATGSDQAVINVTERPGADVVKMTVSVSGKIGPNIDQGQIKKDIAGKKAGEAKTLLESRPGVTKADIKLNPFWVFSIPKNTEKITLIINE